MLSQNRQKPAYSFPELRSPEILQCLEDLRLPLTESDLAKPSPLVVQRIYEAFAEIFMGSEAGFNGNNSELLGRLAAGEIIQYPELHGESVNLVSFYRTM